MWIYDPRVGRFLSVDPIVSQYPELTPYQFASNTPVWAIDLDGLEALKLTQYFDQEGNFQSSEYKWDENESPLENGMLHYYENVGGRITHSISDADDIDYRGGTLSPTPAPASIFGTDQYYVFRDNDFNIRHSLMDTWGSDIN